MKDADVSLIVSGFILAVDVKYWHSICVLCDTVVFIIFLEFTIFGGQKFFGTKL